MLTLDYYETLRNMGFEVNLYQCVSSISKKEYPVEAKSVNGIRFPLYWISLAFDLIVTYPIKFRTLNEDYIFLSDPLLLRLAPKHKNSIVLVHDLRELSPYSSSVFARLLFRYLLRFVKHSKKIIAVSDATKQVLSSFCTGITDIEVIPTCSRIGLTLGSGMLQESHENRVLKIMYVAVDRPYKNIRHFIDLAEEMAKLGFGDNFRFIIISKLRRTTIKYIESKSIENLEVKHSIDDIESLYGEMDVLLFPSLVEGFGLPLLEAMNFGLPIIYSNIPPMKDVVGGYGLPADPTIKEEWINALLELANPEVYNKFSLLSLERSKFFSRSEFDSRVINSFKRYL